MSQDRYALLFLNHGANKDSLAAALREVGLKALEPPQLTEHTSRVAVIIVDRPNSLQICQNLRENPDFRAVPMLALLDNLSLDQVPHYTAVQAEVMHNPVKPLALQNYLQRKLQLNSQPDSEDTAILTNPLAPVPPLPGPPADNSDSAKPKRPRSGTSPPATLRDEEKRDDSTMVEKENETHKPADEIPDSARLLSTVKRAVTEEVQAVLECAHCHWRLRPEDAYCSKCGEQLALLNSLPTELVFEPLGAHQVGNLLDLHNAGQNPLQLSFAITSQDSVGRRFALHTDEVTLGRGEGGQLLITLDANGLDLTARYHALLEIVSNEKGYTKRPVQLIVEPLPRPRVGLAEGARACEYIIGADNAWPVKLHNQGGGTLRLIKLSLESPELDEPAVLLAGTPAFPCAEVKGGNTALINVPLPSLRLAVGVYKGQLNYEFAHLPPQSHNLGINAVSPARLAVEQTRLDFGVISVSREGHAELTVRNTGGEDLCIESLETGKDWLTCQHTFWPLLLAPGVTTIFDLVARGGADWKGRHEGEIIIRSDAYSTPAQSVRWQANFVEPKPHKEFIGIDFGTTASCVAVLDKEDVPRTVWLEAPGTKESGDPCIMPSVLYIGEDGKVLTGAAAIEQRRFHPANAVDSIKRALGGKASFRLGGREYQATEITALIIGELLRRAEDGMFRLGVIETPRQAVATSPVEFTDRQKVALAEACQQAGLEKVSTPLDEASAAALCYVCTRREVFDDPLENLLVFDFGGGTLDCALIKVQRLPPEQPGEKGSLIFETLAISGDPRLGGEDLDWALVGLLSDKVRDAYEDFDADCLSNIDKFKITSSGQLEAKARECRTIFKQQAEDAKIRLSEQMKNGDTETPAPIKLSKLLRKNATETAPFITNEAGEVVYETTLTLAEMSMRLDFLLCRAEGVVRGLCGKAGLALEEVDTILHVGRSSLLKLVTDRINNLLPNALDVSEVVKPKLCVAEGAAHWGKLKGLKGPGVMRIIFQGVGGKHTQHVVGYSVPDFINGSLKRVVKTIFPAHTEFPCRTTESLTPDDGVLSFSFVKNRGLNPVINNNPEIERLGRLYIETNHQPEESVEVEFALDENRRLVVAVGGQTYRPDEMTDDEE